MEILKNTNLVDFAGAHLLAGYGLDPDEMVSAKCYREILAVTDSSAQ